MKNAIKYQEPLIERKEKDRNREHASKIDLKKKNVNL